MLANVIKGLWSDLLDSQVENYRNVKVIDGANGLSEAWLGAKGVGYLSDWINATHTANTRLYAEFIAPSDRWLIIQADVVYTDSPDLILSVYNDYTATAGGDLTILPIRAGAPNISNKPTGSTLRTVTSPVIVPSSLVSTLPLFSASSGNTGGSEANNAFVRLLPPNSPFLLELHNRNNNTHYSQFQIRWSEVPEEYLPTVGV